MYYVIKVGEYYVKSANLISDLGKRLMSVSDIVLSKELMRSFDYPMAELVAGKINGEIIKMSEEVTND